jgi:exonuclease V
LSDSADGFFIPFAASILPAGSYGRSMKGSILQRHGISHLSVTHIAQQFWCERQVELSLSIPRAESPETISGSEIHKDLLLELVKEISVDTATGEDALYTMMLNVQTGLRQLKKEGITRELRIFGKVAGFPVSGIVDELSVKDGMAVLLDHKTRLKPTLPPPPSMKPTEVQVMLYRKLLDDLREGRYSFDEFVSDNDIGEMGKISDEYKADLLSKGFTVKYGSPLSLIKDVFKAYQKIPPISDYLLVRYIHQGTERHLGDRAVLYDPECLGAKVEHASLFWSGGRKAKRVGFGEKWKCNYCEYRGELCKGNKIAPACEEKNE